MDTWLAGLHRGVIEFGVLDMGINGFAVFDMGIIGFDFLDKIRPCSFTLLIKYMNSLKLCLSLSCYLIRG